MAEEPRRIPFDPVKWVENLMEVGEKSDFSADAKGLIYSHLRNLRNDLEDAA